MLASGSYGNIEHPAAKATLVFVSDYPDPDMSWLVEPGTSTMVGVEQVVQARLRDSGGFPVADGSVVTFSIPTNVTAKGVGGGADTVGGPGVVVTRTTVGGTATLTVVSDTAVTQSNAYAITATTGNPVGPITAVRDASAPTEATTPVRTDGRALLWWTPRPASANDSYLSITTTGTKKVGTEYHTAQVLVQDDSPAHNKIDGQKVRFTFDPVGSSDVECEATTDTSGIATCEFTSTLAGTVTVRAYLVLTGATEEVGNGSPSYADFVPNDLCVNETLASLETEAGNAKVGDESRWARVKVQDCYKNPITGVSVDFHLLWARTGSPVSTGPTWNSLSSGKTDESATSVAGGWATVYAWSYYGNVDIPANQFADLSGYGVKASITVGTTRTESTVTEKVSFTDNPPHPDTSWFTVTPAGPLLANGTASYTITAHLRDVDGNPAYYGSALVVIDPSGPVSSPWSLVADETGTATATVTSLFDGTFRTTVSVAGDPIWANAVNSNVRFKDIVFSAGPPNGVNSRLDSPTVSALANGVDTQVIRATVRDSFGASGAGNLIPGAKVAFTVPANTTAKGCEEAIDVTGGAGVICTMTTGSTAGTDKGIAELTLVSTVKGTYTPITAVATVGTNSAAIQTNSPATAVFHEDKEVDETMSTLELLTQGEQKIAGDQNHTARVTIRDAFGNVIERDDGQVLVTLTWTPTTGSGTAGTRQVLTDLGVAVIDFTDVRAGMYSVQATVALKTNPVSGSPKQAEFIAGPAVSATLTATTGKVLNTGLAANAHHATVLVVDKNNNPVNGVTSVQFAVNGDATFVGGGKTRTMTVSGAGLAEVDVVDTLQEIVTLTAAISGITVSPSSVQLEFGPDGVDHATLAVAEGTATGPGGCVVANGTDTWTAKVTAYDASNIGVNGATIGLTVDSPVTMAPSAPYVTSTGTGPGEVNVTLRSTTTGTYYVRATTAQGAATGSPAEITFCEGPVSPANSRLVSPATAATANGTATQVINAILRDANNNAVRNTNVTFQVPTGTWATGCNGVTGNVTGPGACIMNSGTTGQADLTLRSRDAAIYDVYAAVGTTTITIGSPAKAEFIAGSVDYDKSKIEVLEAGPMVANGAQRYTVRVSLFDADLNPVKAAATTSVAFQFTMAGQPNVPDSAVVDANGVATVYFSTEKAGTWQGRATHAGFEVKDGSPVSMLFTHGPLSLPDSDFETSSGTALADGSASHWARVVLKDAKGNPVPGVDVTLAVSQGAASVPGPWFGTTKTTTSVTLTSCPLVAVASTPAWCTQGGVYVPGMVWADIRSDEPGLFQVTATTGGATIKVPGDSRGISFGPGAPDETKSSWTVDPDPAAASTHVVAGGSDTYAIKVTIVSTSSILVDRAPVRLDLNGLPSLSIVEPGPDYVTGTPAGGDWGEFTFHVKSTEPGTFNVPVQVQSLGTWKTITDPAATANLVFKTQAPTVNNTWLVDVPGVVLPGATQTVTAKAVDQYGHAVDNGTIIFHVPTTTCPTDGADVFALKGDQEVSIVNGVASLDLVTFCSGTYQVTADIKGASPSRITMVKAATATTAGAANVRVDGIVNLAWKAGRVHEDHSILTIPTAAGGATKLANGTDQHRAQVFTADELDNPVSDEPVRFFWTATDNPTLPATGVVWNPVSPDVNSDVNGMSNYLFSSASCQYVFIKAQVQGTAGWTDVSGSPQRAQFIGCTVDIDGTIAGFKTKSTDTLPNGTAKSWARTIVVDPSGHGVPGINVTFTVPAGDSPMFVPQGGGAAAKTITVKSCDPSVDSAREACYWPNGYDGTRSANVVQGLAYVELTSLFASDQNVATDFTVTATMDLTAQGRTATEPAGSGVVRFRPGTVAPDKMDFTLVETAGAGHKVLADGSDSWKLTVTLRDSGDIPVSGVCVAASLPANVTVKGSPSNGSCGAGYYPTNAAGQVVLELVTTVSSPDPGYQIGAIYGGNPVPTTQGGTTFVRYAKFVGLCIEPDNPSTYTATLTPPATTAKVGGATLPVIATIRDKNGNPPQCFDPVTGAEVPIPVWFRLLTGLKATVGGTNYTGPADVSVGTTIGGGAGAGLATINVSSNVAATHNVTASVGSPATNWITKGANGTDSAPLAYQAPVTFTSDDPDPKAFSNLSIPTGPGAVLVSSSGATYHTARVYIADAFDNGLPGEAVRVTWAHEDGSGLQSQLASTGTGGIYNLNIASAKSGSYEVRAYVQLRSAWTDTATGITHPAGAWVEIGDSPQTITFKSDCVDVTMSSLTGPTASVEVGNGVANRQTVVLKALDSHGNPATCGGTGPGGVPVVWDLSDPALVAAMAGASDPRAWIVSQDNTTDANGEAKIVFGSTKADTFKVGAAANSQALGAAQGSPAPFTFTAIPGGDKDASLLTVTPNAGNSDPAKVIANGTDSYVLKVQVNDQYGNPTTSGNVVFYVTTTNADASGAVTTLTAPNTGGVAQATFTRTTPGTYYVWATFGTRPAAEVPANKITGSPATAVFSVGGPSDQTSQIARDRGFIEANRADPRARGITDSVLVTVTLRDDNGSIVTGATSQVRVFTDNALAGNPAGVVATNNGNGTYSAVIDSSYAGDVKLSFTIDGRNAQDTLTVKFVPTPLTPVYANARAQANMVSGTAEPGLTIEVYDTNSPNTGNLVCTTVVNASGNWSCTFNSTKSHGDQLFAFAVNRDHIGHSDGTPQGDADHTFTSMLASIVVKGQGPNDPELDPTNGSTISGKVPGYNPGTDGPMTVDVIDKGTGDVLCAGVTVDPQGKFSCTPTKIPDDSTVIEATVRDDAGYEAVETVIVNKIPPAGPNPEPSDGTSITGKGDRPGDKIVITDKDGNKLGETEVLPDGTWKIDLPSKLPEGTIITITETDPAGNTSIKQWRIGIPKIAILVPTVEVGQRQTVTGLNFQPFERIQATQYSAPYQIGISNADANGKVVFNYIIPIGTTIATHKDVLRGNLSGIVEGSFQVVDRQGPPDNPQNYPGPGGKGKLPFTGSNDLIGLSGAALGALLTGLLLLLALKRRRREEEDAA